MGRTIRRLEGVKMRVMDGDAQDERVTDIQGVKAFLMQAAYMDARVNALMERRRHYMEMACKASCRMAGTQPTGGSGYSRVESYSVKLMDLEKMLDRKIDELVDVKRRIEDVILQVPDDRLGDLLTYRYIDGWVWDKIAQALGIDIRWVHRLHQKALLEVGGLLGAGPSA